MMKTIFTFNRAPITAIIAAVFVFCFNSVLNAQICSNPGAVIYGLTANGEIYPLNVSDGSVGTVVKNSTYSGNSVYRANGLGYNNANGKFYYFKRSPGNSSPEFVSYDPATATVTILATPTGTYEVHTGAINATGTGYYTIDINANLYYYNILTNTWTFITSNFTDQDGNNVSNIIKSQNAGDLAFDGYSNLWILTSSNSNYGLYRLAGPMPVIPVAGLTVYRRIAPTTPTPSNMFAGIAFSSTGQIYLATKTNNRLYRLENNLTTTYLGNILVGDLGNDLTSCSFPLAVLPVKWLSYSVSLISNNLVDLKWEVTEQNNAGFTVQHSTNGANWNDLRFIQSNYIETGNGKYFYTHVTPAAGRNYYRIMMTDIDGKQTYSEIKVVAIKTNSTSSITVWPNPANDFISITGTGQNYGSSIKVTVFDFAGKKQLDRQLQIGENSINISSLKTGTYIVNIVASDGTVSNQKFVKQ